MRRTLAVLAGMILMFGLSWAVELADFQPHMKKAGRGVKALKRQLKAQDEAGAAQSAKAVATHFETMRLLPSSDGVPSRVENEPDNAFSSQGVSRGRSSGHPSSPRDFRSEPLGDHHGPRRLRIVL